jgi:mRNA interferase RelE/StbE
VERYSLFIRQSAAKGIEEIGQKRDRQRIVARVSALAENPRPGGCQKLSGLHERYRIRVGDYRVVYAISEQDRAVQVVRVAHRKDVYRGAGWL